MVNLQDLPPELLTRIVFFVAPLRGPLPPGYLEEKLAQKRDNNVNASAGACANTNGINNNDTLDGDDGWDDVDEMDDRKEPKKETLYSRAHRDLRNLCLTSHMFRDLAQPFLFYNFEDTGMAGFLSQTVAFTRALYLRPELGEHVRELDIMYPLDDEDRPKPLAAEDLALFESAIKDLQLGDKEKIWLSGLKRLDLSVLTALLINRAPHLREMFLPAGQVRMDPISHLLDQNPSLLSELQSISLEGDDEELDFDLAPYNKLITLPKLKEANLEFGTITNETFPATWAPGTIAAEKLSFLRCHMDVVGMQKFIQACKRLTSFSYKNFRIDLHEEMPISWRKPEFNAPQFYEAILSHKDSLENLLLTFAYDPWDLENLEEHLARRGKLGSFRDFPNLGTVWIAHALFPEHPEFPPSLKTLHVADCESSIRDMVGNIAADCQKGLYPNLTEFKVFARDITRPIKLPGQVIPEGKTPEQCFTSLRDLFKDTKVDFQIVPDQLWGLRDLMAEDDYEGYGNYDDDDMDYGDIDMDEYEFQLGSDFGPERGFGPSSGAILNALARALGNPHAAHPFDDDGASDNSWETEEDD
ncbi:uncharacterized protein N7496_002814 [Penicillium cataractarum]|uniref:Uncharacterized protein n=1 Tax=Penicillium cataractarum TaxID=2100454 RepID=A0A9W9SKT3_9EURO|nr:uncharacterized protein N7496_002814 [Penicillium cataractarum]KAJ5380386.1 hypothetical protein N7496_002814 [Penicillium cataractarum]